MLFLLATALAIAPPPTRVAAVAQATATIRVIAAVRLKLDGSSSPGAPPARETVVKAGDGSSLPAKLIEFQ